MRKWTLCVDTRSSDAMFRGMDCQMCEWAWVHVWDYVEFHKSIQSVAEQVEMQGAMLRNRQDRRVFGPALTNGFADSRKGEMYIIVILHAAYSKDSELFQRPEQFW